MTGATERSISRRTALRALAGAVAVGGSTGVVGADRDARSGGFADADEESAACDFGAVVDETMGSIVTVRVFDRHQREFVQGSGWVFDRADGAAIVVTNWHVIFGAVGADVRFASGDWRSADRLLGQDRYSDLAVLLVGDAPPDAEPMPIVEEPPEPADPIAVLGTPMGLEQTVTTGVVSAVGRSTTVRIEHLMYTVPSTIQIDAATNPGNSGGPVVDCDGRVVGVQFAGIRPDVGQNINFAISTSMVDRIVPELVETGRFEHPYLGIAGLTVSPMLSRMNEIDGTTAGVYVDLTVDGYPGEIFLQGTSSVDRETGLPIGGDVILAVDGEAVDHTDALRNYLFEEMAPDETVEFTVLRDGEKHEISVGLEARPEELERIDVREPTM